jgi:Holliday junction resolvase RusA-like endonuclease
MVTKKKVQHMQDKNILDILGTPLWSITMPIPPSTNSLFMPVATRGRSRMVITKEYREWRKSLDLIEWKDAPIFTHKVFIVVEVRPGPSLSDKADADNLAKAPVDALVRHQVLVDDNRDYVRGVMTYFGGPIDSQAEGFAIVSIFGEWVLNGKHQEPALFDGYQ